MGVLFKHGKEGCFEKSYLDTFKNMQIVNVIWKSYSFQRWILCLARCTLSGVNSLILESAKVELVFSELPYTKYTTPTCLPVFSFADQ